MQVQSFSIQSLYGNERHLIIKLCTCIITLIKNNTQSTETSLKHNLTKKTTTTTHAKKKPPRQADINNKSVETNYNISSD